MADLQNQIDADQKHLEQFGYKQELQRTLKFFANFGVAFTYLSPVVGFYSLFAFGLQTGGPAFFWGIPIVVIGQLMVVLIFSELAAKYPLAGALYQWARRLMGGGYGWFVGWIYGWALLVTITAVDYGGAPYIASALGLGGNQGQLIVITLVMVVVQTLVNMVGVTRLSILINVGVAMEILGTLGIGVVLLFFPHQPASIVNTTMGVQGHASYFPVFLLALLFSGFIFYGFESAADVAEEVIDPRRRVPKAMIWALMVGGITTMFAVFAFLHATPNMALAMNAAKTPNPITYILTATIGATSAKIFLWVVIIAFLSCGAAVEAAATRVFYSYARDRVIPFSKFLSHVSPKYHTPTNALWLSGLVALLLSFSAKFESILTSFAVVGIYLAFQMIMLGALIARSRGVKADALFNLRGWVWPINVVALIYGVGMIINLARPTNPTAPWYINYEVILATAAIIVLGLVVYFATSASKQVQRLNQAQSEAKAQ
ncbi:MAG: amino acid permease [Sulfobacillus benefaciens]|uniref:Amino acid permease n=1 Tax=Sulfobacillus benefaciens TaxID=453960 RepID=A0A2T2XL08_9FIRM|nr:MAG: amino acid permease [Sulfobacillus benefaciens]